MESVFEIWSCWSFMLAVYESDGYTYFRNDIWIKDPSSRHEYDLLEVSLALQLRKHPKKYFIGSKTYQMQYV